MSRVNLRAVAKQAGVSYQTVSNVINKEHMVKPETRDRVKQVIEQMGYVPNYAAKALRESRAMTIACVFYQVHENEVNDPYRTLIQAALAHAARKHHHSLLTYLINNDPESLQDIMQHFAQRRLDGAVLIGPVLPDPVQVQLRRSKQPLVMFDYTHPRRDWLSVTAAYREGIVSVMDHLASRGKRRMAFLAGDIADQQSSSEERLQGYHEGLENLGMTVPTSYVHQGNWTFEGGQKAFRHFWSLDPRPEAIIAANDRMAAGLLNAALRAGVTIPQDLAVTGVDDFEFAHYLLPSLTTVQIPYQEMASEAIRLLLEQMNGQIHSGVIRLPVTLKIRESS